MKALVKIMPKKGVLDPQGKAIEKSLNQLGFPQINKVIQGKLIEDETIFNNDIEIGKVLINDDYPFALIKYLDKNFDKNNTFVSKNGTFKILVPTWLNI